MRVLHVYKDAYRVSKPKFSFLFNNSPACNRKRESDHNPQWTTPKLFPKGEIPLPCNLISRAKNRIEAGKHKRLASFNF